MNGFLYEESLQRLGLFSIEKGHLRWGMIEVYKILKDAEKVNRDLLFISLTILELR